MAQLMFLLKVWLFGAAACGFATLVLLTIIVVRHK